MKPAMTRRRNFGVRKVCTCRKSRWPKCPHAWHFNFTLPGGPLYRLSLDREVGRRITSRAEAEHEADLIRTAIRERRFQPVATRHAATALAECPGAGDVQTLDAVSTTYISRVAKVGLKGQGEKTSWKNDQSMVRRFCAFTVSDGQRLGSLSVTMITEDVIEAFFATLAAAGLAVSTRNQYVQVIKAFCRWAVRKGYLPTMPLSDETNVKRAKVAQRRRRLLADEETAVLAAAGSATRGAALRLQWLIIAALETGCRRGELLALRWADVNLEKRTLLVRAVEDGAKKTGRSRELPISARLKAVLEMAHTDAKRRETNKPTHYVFGNPIGDKVKNTKRSWETAVLRAHGHKPTWVRSSLSAASRATLATIDLEFRDLRHEAGCRWLEAGIPLHHIQEMLGHANLSQTSTYLHASEFGLKESMDRFDAVRAGKPQAKEAPIDPPPSCQLDDAETDKGTIH